MAVHASVIGLQEYSMRPPHAADWKLIIKLLNFEIKCSAIVTVTVATKEGMIHCSMHLTQS